MEILLFAVKAACVGLLAFGALLCLWSAYTERPGGAGRRRPAERAPIRLVTGSATEAASPAGDAAAPVEVKKAA